MKLIPGLKDPYPWLREVDSTALQPSVFHMDQAYRNFFAGRKGKRKVGFPKFKSKRHSRASYTSQNIQVNDSAVKLPKLGWVKSKVSPPGAGTDPQRHRHEGSQKPRPAKFALF